LAAADADVMAADADAAADAVAAADG